MVQQADNPSHPDRIRRSLRDGFEGLVPASNAEHEAALRDSLVVLDANVLLNLYRYGQSTREDLFSILAGLGERLWVPHQAALEFWRNRLAVLDGRGEAVRQAVDSLEKSRRTAAAAIASWAKHTGLPDPERKELSKGLDDFFKDIVEAVASKAEDDASTAYGPDKDEVLQQLETLLDGRVGGQLTLSEWTDRIREGRRRVGEGQPPGYLDAHKEDSELDEGAAGDYLIWSETMHESKKRDLDVLFITGDDKEDWWWLHRGMALGPRMELIDELREFAGRRLHMMRPTQLLRYGSILDVQVRQESVDDAQRVSKESAEVHPWTREGVLELLRRLDAEGKVQADVIRAAASNNGRVDRQTVYNLGKYSDDRMLRGFTRPVARITRSLQEDELLPTPLAPLLRPIYVDMLAAEFAIPDEVVEILNSTDHESNES